MLEFITFLTLLAPLHMPAEFSSTLHLEVKPTECFIDSIASGGADSTLSIVPETCHQFVGEPQTPPDRATVTQPRSQAVKGEIQTAPQEIEPLAKVSKFIQANRVAAVGSVAAMAVITTLLVLRSISVISFRSVGERIISRLFIR